VEADRQGGQAPPRAVAPGRRILQVAVEGADVEKHESWLLLFFNLVALNEYTVGAELLA
jgi:hypothetical protein